MLDALFKALDLLLKVLSFESARSERLLKEVFTPLFESLKSIHTDYNAIFGALLKDIPSTLTAEQWPVGEAQNVAIKLSDLRREFAPLRQQVRGAAKALSTEQVSEPASLFIAAVLAYFPSGQLNPDISANDVGSQGESASSGIIKAIYKDLEVGRVGAFDLRDLVERTLTGQEARWQQVSEAYARLQISVLA